MRQEEHIVWLARDGRTNPEIAAELFISTHIVGWRLRKIFAKLGIAPAGTFATPCPAVSTAG